MGTIVNILGIFGSICCILSFCFKKKEHFLMCLVFYNTFILISYLIQAYYLESVICLICIIKSLIFYLYDKKKLKPNFIVVVVFELTIIASSILLWENWFSVFLLISSMVGTYASWQDNMLVLRISYVICSICLISSYICTGQYVTIVAESIVMITDMVSIFTFHIIPRFAKSKTVSVANSSDIPKTTSTDET